MVTGFKQYRFYRRGEQRTILMEEPEIRERYMRIAASRQALDASIEAAIASECALLPQTHESVFVVPWFGHRDLVNPQALGVGLGQEVATKALRNVNQHWPFQRLEVVSDGYRGYDPSDRPLHACSLYACIRRTGLVHIAKALLQQPQSGLARMNVTGTLETLITAILAARYVLDNCAYWGPVRVIHRLRTLSPFHLKDPTKHHDYEFLTQKKPIAPGTYDHVLPEVNLTEQGGSITLILRELLHQIFQTNGEAGCPWFDTSGRVRPNEPQFLQPHLYEYLVG
jgi:hypothetical protein